MNYAAGNDVRRSLLSTLHVLEHNKDQFHTIKDISVEMQKITGTYNEPHRRQIYRNVNCLIDFGFPIIKEIGAHNEYKFKWDDSTFGNTRKVDFVERFSQYSLSRTEQDQDDLEEYMPN